MPPDLFFVVERHADADATVGSVLDSVGKEVEQHLAHPHRIRDHAVIAAGVKRSKELHLGVVHLVGDKGEKEGGGLKGVKMARYPTKTSLPSKLTWRAASARVSITSVRRLNGSATSSAAPSTACRGHACGVNCVN